MKTCPKCKIAKPLTGYDAYWSKSRDKHRPQSRCRECCQSDEGRKEANQRAKKAFELNKDKKLQYAKDYRADPNNKQKLKSLSQSFKVKYRKELKECYVADHLSRKMGVKAADVRSHPTLIEDYRATLKLNRLIKKLENEKQKL